MFWDATRRDGTDPLPSEPHLASTEKQRAAMMLPVRFPLKSRAASDVTIERGRGHVFGFVANSKGDLLRWRRHARGPPPGGPCATAGHSSVPPPTHTKRR